jgi:hypothetical protein
MNVLMIGVFAFFGLHTSLWLTRSMIEMGRARKPPGESRKEPIGEDGEGENGSRDA